MNFSVASLLVFLTALTQFVSVSSKSELAFPDHSSSHDPSVTSPFNYEHASFKGSDPSPQAKHFGKVKKLQKKLLLMCLFGGPATVRNGKIRRRTRSVNVNGKFLYPSIVQQTDVNVGGSFEDDASHDGSGSSVGSFAGHIGGFDCNSILNLAPINHPLLGLLGGGTGGDNDGDTSDETDTSNKMLYNRNINRHIIRPLYRSMRQFYNFYGSGFF